MAKPTRAKMPTRTFILATSSLRFIASFFGPPPPSAGERRMAPPPRGGGRGSRRVRYLQIPSAPQGSPLPFRGGSGRRPGEGRRSLVKLFSPEKLHQEVFRLFL